MSPVFTRIWICGLRAVLSEKFISDVPLWIRDRWPSWSAEKRKFSLWVVLDSFCGGVIEGVEWYELILWGKDQMPPKDLKWIVRALRHYHVERLWDTPK